MLDLPGINSCCLAIPFANNDDYHCGYINDMESIDASHSLFECQEGQLLSDLHKCSNGSKIIC